MQMTFSLMGRPDIVDYIFSTSRVPGFTFILELMDVPSLSFKKNVSPPRLEPPSFTLSGHLSTT